VTTPEVHATPSPPFCSPKPVVAARHPPFVFVLVSGVRHISARPQGNVGASHEPNCDQRGLHLGDPGGVRRCVHRRSPGSATRHPRWMETSLRPLAARPRRSTARAHPDHTPTTPRPHPDHTPTTPRPHPDLAPTSPGCWRCGRGSAAYALPMLGARTSCPAWCASRAVRAPGVKWTAFARIEDGQGLRTAVSMSTSPVRISDDPERTQIAGLLAMRAVRWCARAGAGAHLGDVPG
jgi:hypothetical protein